MDIFNFFSGKKVLIWADASVSIGLGHVMRCLALARMLEEKGAKVTFLCREISQAIVEDNGFTVVLVPHGEDVLEKLVVLEGDWLVVDDYSIDAMWERLARTTGNQIMVIDDLANRLHDCDVLLDQNLYDGFEKRYDHLVPAACKKILGPRFSLLRPEFQFFAQQQRSRDGSVRKILVSFGGSDPTNETAKILYALKHVQSDLNVQVVAGALNPNLTELMELADQDNRVQLRAMVNNMAELMVEADLAMGAGGSTTWERCSVGLPSITIVVADNQRELMGTLDRLGALWNLGESQDVTAEQIAEKIRFLLESHEEVARVAVRAKSVMAIGYTNLKIEGRFLC